MVSLSAKKLPSDEELLTILNAKDLLSVAVRGHQSVETALGHLLSEALPAPHELEIARLTFALKVDLAIAFRLLPSESRALFMAVNKVRNKFAHDGEAAFEGKQAADLSNAFSDLQRHLAGTHPKELSTPRQVLEYAIAVIFTEASAASQRIADQKLYAEVMHEMVQDTLKHRRGKPHDEYDRKVQNELRSRYERRKVGAKPR